MINSDPSVYGSFGDQQSSIVMVLAVLIAAGALAMDATPVDAGKAGQGTALGGAPTTVAWSDPNLTVTIDGDDRPLVSITPGSLAGKTLRIDNAADSPLAAVVVRLVSAGAMVQISSGKLK